MPCRAARHTLTRCCVLDIVCRQVSEAEAALAANQADLGRSESELAISAGRITQLRSEQERAREAVTMGERSLGLARHQAQQSRLLLNPLNHPKVKAFLTGGRGTDVKK